MNLPIDYKLYYDKLNFHGSNNLIQLLKRGMGEVEKSHNFLGKVGVLSNQTIGQIRVRFPQLTREVQLKTTAAIISSSGFPSGKRESCKDKSKKEK